MGGSQPLQYSDIIAFSLCFAVMGRSTSTHPGLICFRKGLARFSYQTKSWSRGIKKKIPNNSLGSWEQTLCNLVLSHSPLATKNMYFLNKPQNIFMSVLRLQTKNNLAGTSAQADGTSAARSSLQHNLFHHRPGNINRNFLPFKWDFSPSVSSAETAPLLMTPHRRTVTPIEKRRKVLKLSPFPGVIIFRLATGK